MESAIFKEIIRLVRINYLINDTFILQGRVRPTKTLPELEP